MTTTIDHPLTEETLIPQLVHQFPRFLEEFQTRQEPLSYDKTCEAITRFLEMPCSAFDTEPEKADARRHTAIKRVMKRYVVDCLATRFPKLDQRLFDLQRYVQVEFEGTQSKPRLVADQRMQPDESELIPVVSKTGHCKMWIQTPLVVPYTPASGNNKTVHLKSFNHPKARSGWRHEYNIKATFPGEISPEHKATAHEGFAIVLSAAADLFRSPGAGFLSTDPHRHDGDYTRPTLKAIWIPVFEALSIEATPPPPQDPALLLVYQGEHFLVGTWETPHYEEPIDDFLKEFVE